MSITEPGISGIAIYHRHGVEEAEMTQANEEDSLIRDGMIANLLALEVRKIIENPCQK